MLLTLATLAVGAVFATGAYLASPLRRLRRSIGKARRALRKEIKATSEVLESREAAVRATAQRYLDAQVDQRLKRMPIDVLKSRMQGSFRLQPLRDAGIEMVFDLKHRRAAGLIPIKGVGPKTASAVVKATRDVVGTLELERAELPAPALEQPLAEDLARDTLVYLRARRQLGDAPAGMREAMDEVDWPPRATGFVQWAGGVVTRTNDEREAALRDTECAARELAQREVFRETERRRLELSREPRPADVRAEFDAEYPECCAVIEGVFADLRPLDAAGVRAPPPGQQEIVRRVEGFPLDTTGLKVVLRRYQEFGAKFLLAQERTILGDEMGLGKTIEALAAVVHLSPGHFLVVAPASILANWAHEIRKRTNLACHLLHGDDFAENNAKWKADGGIAVTSYATLRRGGLDAPERIALVVADEAHYAKNPKAGRTRALREVLTRAQRATFMSGTPMENHPEEFVALLRTLRPKREADLAEFVADPARHLGSPQRFHSEVSDVYLRRNQEDVLRELPERIDKDEWVDLDPAAQAAYAEAVASGNFMAMRQAVTVGGEAKLGRLDEILDEYEESGAKVLVFSYFLDVLRQVGERFANHGSITGSMSPDDRFALVQDFQAAEGHRLLLLLQIQAGGQGLNLQAASGVVIMEPQLKPTTEAQAVARAHRMGQTRRVVVHRLLARNSVDERLVEILKGKRELFEQFARQSLIKEASAAATEPGLAQAIVRAEQARLGS